ncbi:GntR family transcriptional regulator [Brevibacterium sp. 50QC2O2]|uniref:GntR family transcriptional regulator n=1 Tax=Brevibacterium sp. 50QC2O2 TaxID=2968459 RepID=UPI00211BB709|nr:GntR family transcriptional regulator [Brevibacterium sp. 50QC2O2]MCQ9389634.1 GntR family transcriptional regulator [Brevibacterium sp. 50QC2O2]
MNDSRRPAAAGSNTGRTSISATERAYRSVKADILSGRLGGGTMTSEGEVAEDLGISRTPVREAFLRLETEGFLALYPKRGALVVPVAPGEAEEILDARHLIETHAAGRIAELPQAQRTRLIDELHELISRQREAHHGGDVAEYTAVDAEFHLAITSAGGNTILANFAHLLRDRQQRVTAGSLHGRPETAEAFIDSHERLADHLAAGDARAYAQELREHFDMVRKEFK